MKAEFVLEIMHSCTGLKIPIPPMRAGRLSRLRSMSLTWRLSRARMNFSRIASSSGWKCSAQSGMVRERKVH